jgi:hypothetical protein
MICAVKRMNSTLGAWGKAPRRALASLAVALVASLSLAGCGGSIGGYCYEAKNCEGGNDFDEEACNLSVSEIQDLADLQNCSSEFDAWFDCVESNSRCNDDRYQVDEGACGAEEEQLYNCADVGGNF